jgi:hypothetical protein
MTARGVLSGFLLGTLLIGWVAAWWWCIAGAHRWLWRMQDRVEQAIRRRQERGR